MDNVLVIGAGVMGSAIGIYLGNNGQKVNLWGTKMDEAILREMESTRIRKDLNIDIPNNISLFHENQLEEAFKDTKLIIIAVISKGMESISKLIGPYLKDHHIILSVTKGIDENNLYTMSTVIENSVPVELKEKIGIVKLGGPIIAMELAHSKFTEGIFASKDIESAKYARDIFKSPRFKGGITQDIEGVELCAAFKNSYAIAMGMVEGLEGDMNNPKAALMARGTMEMANIVEAYGGSRETALGIAGVGDYYVTSQGGRNGIFGKYLGHGKNIDEALEAMNNQTVEGLAVTLNGYKFLKQLEEKGNINMERDTPLFKELYKVLYEEKSVKDAIASYWMS